MTLSAPVAARHPHVLSAHGHDRDDPYFWLRDPEWREVMRDPARLDPEIRAYLEAENAWTKAQLADVAALEADLFEELKARIRPDDSAPPSPDGPWRYFSRYLPGAEHPQYCRSPRAGGEPEVLLDGDAMAKDHAFFRLASVRHSPDHGLVGYAVDTRGSELFAIAVRDVATGETIDRGPQESAGDLVWSADGRAYFYTALNDDHRPDRVYLHRLGDDPADDDLVFQEDDPGYFVSVDKGESGRFAYITSHASETAEVRFVPADVPDTAPAVVAARREGHDYDVTDQGGRFVIRTNRDGAEDYKLMQAPLDAPAETNWTDLVPAEAGCLRRSVLAFRDWLVRLETVDALPRIVVTETATGADHIIAFDEEAYGLGVSAGLEFATDTLRFSYSSPTTPERVYDYDMRTRDRVLVKEQEIPSGHNPADYVVRRQVATGHDGARIPVTILHRADMPPAPERPVLLYGYGSYGISMPASFSPNRLSLVNRGFTYVIAHIRGGMERGWRWYLDGKLKHKTNTFRDFVSSAEHLVATGQAAAGNIAIHGGSAGGMLVGAAANMRPDLWRAVVAEVPFVDCLTTILDASLPLTPPEWTEWGNPIESEEIYRLMLSYSPYDNVAATAYPAMLVTGGLTDPRVTYWEPAKWVAKLRATRTNDSLLLLKINMEAGHAGSAGRFDKLKEIATNYAFLLKVFGKAG
ncbi:MAG: S9 family peptidase [Pseudomonadota bacterium]|nr:S9 family peptidase [Pseudomonadota bacterium]